jgi:hypothetical protein
MELYECEGISKYKLLGDWGVRSTEHSPLVNVSPNCDSDTYAELWNKQKSNAMRIGCDYVTFHSLDPRNLPSSLSR